MANQSAARIKGDRYQHLYSWNRLLELKDPRKHVRLVSVEDRSAGSFDDVTVRHEAGTTRPNRFYQVKYHVNQGGAYSTETLIQSEPKATSLLEKFWSTWRILRGEEPSREIELYLVSNWPWDSADKIRKCIGGGNNGLTDSFFASGPRSDVSKLRERWRSHLSADPADFTEFARCLRFRLGCECSDDLRDQVSDTMRSLGLKHDDNAIDLSVSLVQRWITDGPQEISTETLEQTFRDRELYLPPNAERCVTVYLHTIKVQQFNIEPDYHLDWRSLFEGSPYIKGHRLIDPGDWNGRMLPEMHALAARIGQETACRLIRARGAARLSAWLAFGHTFSEVANYTIEVVQGGSSWRTDTPLAADFTLTVASEGAADGESLLDEHEHPLGGDTVAVGISITGDLEVDVRKYLPKHSAPVSALLLLRPERELGQECIRGAGDLVAMARQAKSMIRQFVKKREARRLLLFYFGPFSGACFLGHQLNAVAEIQVMEDQQPGYAPSFELQ